MLKFDSKLTLFFILLVITVFFAAGCSGKKIKTREARVRYQEGIKLSAKGRFEKALEKFNESIDASREAGLSAGVAHNYNEIGNVYTYKNEHRLAREYYQQALAIYQKKNMSTEVSKCLDNIAKSFLRQGYYGKSLDTYKQLAGYDEANGNMLGKGIVKFNMGLIYERYIRDYDAAEELFGEALTIFLNLGREKETNETRKSLRRIQVLKKGVPRV